MTLLASTDDFQAITGQTLDGSGLTRVSTLLGFASDAVLASAHGQEIVQSESTETLRQFDGVFYFPQRPVAAVSLVEINGLTVDPSLYRWEAGGNRRPAKLIRRYLGSDYRWGEVAEYPWAEFPGRYPYLGRTLEAEATVTYTHGWDPIPGQIIGAVVAMVAGVMETGGGTRVSSEANGTWQAAYETGQASDFSVSDSTRKLLDRLCGVDGFAFVPAKVDHAC